MIREEMPCHVYDLFIQLARRNMMKCRAIYMYYYQTPLEIVVWFAIAISV